MLLLQVLEGQEGSVDMQDKKEIRVQEIDKNHSGFLSRLKQNTTGFQQYLFHPLIKQEENPFQEAFHSASNQSGRWTGGKKGGKGLGQKGSYKVNTVSVCIISHIYSSQLFLN